MRSRTLWVSPTNSPVRLGVFPTSSSTSTGVFNQWFEALFLCAGLRRLSRSPVVLPRLSACKCGTAWSPSCYLTQSTALPIPVCQPEPRLPWSSRCLLAASPLPWLPVSALPTSLDECFFLTPWLSDFHTVLFSGSSGYFLFLNLWLSFWLYEEAKCIHLHLHLGQKSFKVFDAEKSKNAN